MRRESDDSAWNDMENNKGERLGGKKRGGGENNQMDHVHWRGDERRRDEEKNSIFPRALEVFEYRDGPTKECYFLSLSLSLSLSFVLLPARRDHSDSLI